MSLPLPNIARPISHPACSSTLLATRSYQHSGRSSVARRRVHPWFRRSSSVYPFHVHLVPLMVIFRMFSMMDP
ncbi:uncharacterized protein F5891DRAFT_1179793 [Suillus fuscotomentosus]|uniref:Uncharacterized protein n=1 Tax=Suillus fuscotomentosus TaxID=1912939 RepID=A0AAD4ELJ0_9AGAM|nr:uncharacterized protein F5891DRAFT_1179793 [Suillus fuscotomentosus]KAG1908281.1 hypothetical protein F5891DRAFT_1179793 [Suillus fuscotomentosus]